MQGPFTNCDYAQVNVRFILKADKGSHLYRSARFMQRQDVTRVSGKPERNRFKTGVTYERTYIRESTEYGCSFTEI